MELGYLISPIVQIVDNNGKPVVGAKIYVYNANTSVLVDTYNDFEYHLNTNPVLTDTLGNCTIIADTSKAYDIIVNDENDVLLFGKKNITIASGIDPTSALAFEGGDGIIVERTGNTVTISVDTALIATQDDLATKQDKIYAGNNIVINDNTVALASAVHLANVLYETDYKRNGIETKSNLTEDYTVVKPDGVRIANESDDVYFVIDQHAIEGGDGNDIVRLDATSLDIDHNDSSQQRQIHLGTAGGPYSDWVQGLLIKNSVNAGSLSATTYDVKLQNNSGTYSLTAANQLANSALSAAHHPGQFLSAGANIKISGDTISGKSWTNEIAAATSGKLDTSATTNWDIAAYSAGANININNHVVSGKSWTNEIAAATSGKIDKVAGGAGSEVNPVYLDASNVVRPCFSGESVKLASWNLPYYFAGDLAGNTFIYNDESHTSPSAYSIRNSIIIGNGDNYRRSASSTEHFDKCIFMGGAYMYGSSGSPTLSNNVIIGGNSISQVDSYSNNNTVIGTDNDIMCSNMGKCDTNTIVGYQNNIWGVGQCCTMYGSNNDINPDDESYSCSQLSIFGYNNKWRPKSNGLYDSLILGNCNNVAQSGNCRTMAVGFSNTLSGNCTTLIGNDLSASNEGSWDNQVMKVGFGKCHLEIHSSGTIYKVVNGTKTPL